MSRHPLDTIVRHLRQLVGSDPAGEREDGALLDRFIRHGDEGAFAALVERYGPLVLGLCRRLLANAHDADDAFQATFLVLARRAGAIRKQRAVGSWLYGVAYRVALEARARAARRRIHERQALAMTPRTEDCPETNQEPEATRALLDAELQRLPEKYRAPLVLCYLEGKTNEQAARQLGCPTSSLSWRLGRARELLRQRLVRRGVALSATGLAALLGENAHAALSTALAASTARAALLFTTGKAAAVSAEALALSEGVLHAMRVTKLRLAAVMLVALGLVGASAGLVLLHAQADNPPAAAAKSDVPRFKDASAAQLDESIVLGLRWLARKQANDGHWAFDGSISYPTAATSMALLPFLRAGETPGGNSTYAKSVDRGLNYLLGKQAADGGVPEDNQSAMYNHALATMALCEAFARTGDPKLKQPAQRAIDFIVAAQAKQGGWTYRPAQGDTQRSDTSVTTYQVEALKSGELAGLKVPKEAWDRVSGFLDSVVAADGSYRYVPQQGMSSANLTACGILCRQLLGQKPDETFAKGLASLKAPGLSNGWDGIYYLYRATRVMNCLESEAAEWNRKVRARLVAKQVPTGADAGSWDHRTEIYCSAPGRIMTTSLALLTLLEAPEPLPTPRDLNTDEVETLWKDLAGEDVFKASQGMRTLAVAPRQTLPFLEKQLKPVAAVDPKAIERWIEGLGSNSFQARQRATEELEKLGELAAGSLEKALEDNPPLDLRQRVERLLAKVDNDSPTPERLQSLRAIRVLERIGSADARRTLRALAGGAPGARPTREAAAALERLAPRAARP